jgi:N utilization substance protein B
VISAIIKTIKTIDENRPFTLLPLYRNGEDETFAGRLLQNAIVNFDKYNKLIDEHTPNWDVERIALMDILILILAVAEIIEFPNIPVKVSLDEYIELARYYSTTNSCVFVNGVLDSVVSYLSKNNMLRKAGFDL